MRIIGSPVIIAVTGRPFEGDFRLAYSTPSMPGWTLVDTHPTQGRTFQRPLDTLELSFFWDGLFNGTADNIQHVELRLLNGSRDAHLFSVANIVRAWLSTKRRYPLAVATVRGDNALLCLRGAIDSKVEGGDGGDANDTESTSESHFVVQERDLSVLRPREIVFGWVTGAEEAQQRIATILDGPRPLSEELLVQLYVFRETDSKRTDVLHLMTLMAHCVTDQVANSTFMRCLLDTFARGGGSDSEPAQMPLEDRLTMATPSMELEPIHLRSLSPAKRRWRRAVGVVILRLRMAKRQGGHTLPCRLTSSTPHVATRSGHLSTLLTLTQSATVFANCRLHDITFGNAYLALAQVAMTRVLYRRYLRGQISEQEWAYRKRQPHISGGPLNLRPYLDKAWFDRGGGGEFMVSIGFFCYLLPFMTLGTAMERPQHREHDQERVLSDGAPPFSDLLTFDRFLHRAELVKKQTTAFFSHPLFFEIARAASLSRVENVRLGVLQWMKRIGNGDGNGMHRNEDAGADEVLSVMDMPVVWAHWGSNVGNVDLASPSAYPLPPTHPLSPYASVPHPLKAGYITPPSPSPSSSPYASEADAPTPTKIAIEHTTTYLHTRPGELYLGAARERGRLKMFVYHDRNVFEDGVVREWLDEIMEAVLWYLGRTHPRSCRARRGRGGGDGDGDGDGQAGLGERVRTHL